MRNVSDMPHSFFAITLAMLASSPVDDVPSPQKWGIVQTVDLSSATMVYDMLGNSWNIDGRLIWGQVNLNEEEVSISVAGRGCLDGATDYRQNVTFPRGEKEAEVSAVKALMLKLVSVVQDQCSLGRSTTDTFIDGLEVAYRDIYDKNKLAKMTR